MVSPVRPGPVWRVFIASCSAFSWHLCRAEDANQIVERATAALKSDWAADSSYASIERDEALKHGRVTSKTFEVVMIDGSDYQFPLAIDDQPLPPGRHQAEIVKLKHEIERRRNESPSARQSRIEAWKKQRDENGELLLDFPTSLQFHLEGEEIKDGHPAYVLSATPRPGVIATTRAAKVLTGIQGKAWVEKQTLHPIGVECTLVKAVPVFGALASVLPGTEIEIGMTKVAESVWLIDRVSMKLNVSKLHMFKSSSATHSTYTHYQPNSVALEELLSRAKAD